MCILGIHILYLLHYLLCSLVLRSEAGALQLTPELVCKVLPDVLAVSLVCVVYMSMTMQYLLRHCCIQPQRPGTSFHILQSTSVFTPAVFAACWTLRADSLSCYTGHIEHRAKYTLPTAFLAFNTALSFFKRNKPLDFL